MGGSLLRAVFDMLSQMQSWWENSQVVRVLSTSCSVTIKYHTENAECVAQG